MTILSKTISSTSNDTVSTPRISISTKLTVPSGSSEADNSKAVATPGSSSSVDADIEAIVNERMEQKIAKYNAKFQELRQQMEALEAEKIEAERRQNSNIASSLLLEEVFGDRESSSIYQKRIAETLSEAMEHGGDDNLPKFVIRFSKGWVVLQRSLSCMQDAEKGMPQLDMVCDALSFLLSSISGCYVSERRSLLEIVASHCGEFFQDFIFVSPEHTLNFDPEIHNMVGNSSGNQIIKEGLSFAVIRSDTKKTVRYADVVLS